MSCGAAPILTPSCVMVLAEFIFFEVLTSSKGIRSTKMAPRSRRSSDLLGSRTVCKSMASMGSSGSPNMDPREKKQLARLGRSFFLAVFMGVRKIVAYCLLVSSFGKGHLLFGVFVELGEFRIKIWRHRVPCSSQMHKSTTRGSPSNITPKETYGKLATQR